MIYSICSIAEWLLPAIGAASNIVGGLFGSSAQKDANRANLQIARETNEVNRQMFDDQMAFNERMWNATNAYNSPENQRKLLEDAGYNPALFSGQDTQASNISAPSANPAIPGAPQQPVMSFAENISNAVGTYAQNMLALNSARKEKADAIKSEIDALTQGAENQQRLKSLKESTTGQQLDNMLKDLTMDSQVAASQQNVELLRQNTKNVIADTILKNVTIELQQANVSLTEQEIEKAKQLVLNAIQEGKNLITQNELLQAGISEAKSRQVLNYVNAEMARVVGNSQAAANYASAESSHATAQFTLSQKEQQDLQNRLTRKYGKSKALAELVQMASVSQLNDMEAKKAAIEFVKLRREYKFMPIDRVADMVKGISGAAMLMLLL